MKQSDRLGLVHLQSCHYQALAERVAEVLRQRGIEPIIQTGFSPSTHDVKAILAEHGFIERNDGSLWILARTGKEPMQSFSTDLGKTWSTPATVKSFSHPVGRLHLRRLASE